MRIKFALITVDLEKMTVDIEDILSRLQLLGLKSDIYVIHNSAQGHYVSTVKPHYHIALFFEKFVKESDIVDCFALDSLNIGNFSGYVGDVIKYMAVSGAEIHFDNITLKVS